MAFQFQLRHDIDVPPAARTAGFVHPFPWADMADALKAGKKPSFPVPKEYWTKERGIEEKNATAENARNRILAAFKTWQKANKREDLMIVTRTHKDTGAVEVWMRNADAGQPQEGNGSEPPQEQAAPSTPQPQPSDKGSTPPPGRGGKARK